MKKIPALLVAGALLALALVSCSSNAAPPPKLDPADPITLTVWHYYNGPQKTAFDNMVLEFNDTVGRDTGIVVEAFSQGNVDTLSQKVLDSAHQVVGAEPMPHIFATYADTAYQVHQLDLMINLDDYFTEEELAAYRAEFITEGRIASDQCLVIFPIAKSVELLMLNLTDWNRFADDTGATLDQLSTIEGVVSTAQSYYRWTDRLTASPNDGKSFFGRDAMANYMIIGCRQLGLELFQIDGDAVTVHTDEDILRKLWDNYYVPYINGWFSSNGRFRSDEAKLGDIICLVGSSSAASYFPTEISVDDLNAYPIESLIMPAPQFADSQRYAVQQGAGMAVMKSDAEHEYASAFFLKWFTDTRRNSEFTAASGGYLPVKNDALSLDAIQAALTAGDAPSVEQTFSAALEELSCNTMYTPPPFNGNIEARAILERSMNERSELDRAAILALIDQGVTPADAVARYDTEENFRRWFDSFTADLEAAVASAQP